MIALLISIALLFTVAACGPSGDTGGGSGDTGGSSGGSSGAESRPSVALKVWAAQEDQTLTRQLAD